MKRHSEDLFEIYDWSFFITQRLTNPDFVVHHDYSLIWIEAGEAPLCIDEKQYLIAPGLLCCIRPGQQISCTPTEPMTGYVISFAAGFLDLHDKKSAALIQDSLFNHFMTAPVVQLTNSVTIFMHYLAAKMLEEFAGHAAYRKEILKGFFKIFIIYTGRAAQTIVQPRVLPQKAALVMQFYDLLEKYFKSKKMVKDYAGMLHVSSGYLNDSVRQISGMSASYHIQQRVIREAKRKICFEGSSMKEIAFSLGFCDQAHFSKYFKNIAGINFTDFKNDITSY